MNITSFSELKKSLTVGTKLKLVWSCIPDHKYLNKTREVIKQQTNAIKFEGGSWLGLGSTGETAKDFIFFENGFSLLDNGKEFLRYEFIK